MSGKTARAARKTRVAEGLAPFADPVHNFLDEEAEDTRRDRRLKKHHKKRHAAELRATSHRERILKIRRWNKIFGPKPKKEAS